jgi:putative peptidoglycan lipid II flippase
MNLLKAALSISAMMLLSRITGLINLVIGAHLFGAGAQMDAFQVAWRIPNFLRRLFAEGAFSQAFVPVFAEYRAKLGAADSKLLADHVASLLALILLVVSVLGVVVAPALVFLMASGFTADADKFDLTVQMVRITFPYIFFISLVALAAGVLNTFSAFKIPAFTPVLLNLSMIAASILIAPHIDPPILALAIGAMVGGVVQLIFQYPALKRIGMLPRLSWRPSRLNAARKNEGVVRILKLMVPATLGVSVAQISILLNTQIASHLGDGAVSWISYADRLMEFPSALLGVALGTVLLPSLVKHHADENPAEYAKLLDWGLRITLMLTLPAALALAILSTPLISTIFQHGAFSAHDVTMTRSALMAYSVGLTGIILVKILAPGFYARQNIKTPVKIAVVTLVATQGFNLAFVPLFGHAGLTLSTGLGACVNAGLLYYFIRKYGFYVPQPAWLSFFMKLLVALAVMGGALWWAMGIEAAWLTMTATARAIKLSWIILMGVALYFGSLWLMGVRLKDFAKRGA